MSTPALIESGDRFPEMYEAMCAAISACHDMDECKVIADKSRAFAAYFKTIKDDETVRKFNEIKIRAWRRLGELMLVVDLDDCETQVAKVKKLRSELTDIGIGNLKDWEIINALKLAQLPKHGFESAVTHVNGSIQEMLRIGDPEKIEREEAERRDREAAWEAARPERERKEREAQEERERLIRDRLRDQREEAEEVQRLKAANEEAMREAGLTMDRRDRKKQRELLFIMKAEVYEALRDAAHEKRVTMHEILRRGLAMWFAAHGYAVRKDSGDAA